ncbi:MAG: glycosyltransferase family 2 protein [Vicinamibacterales bacterium]
MSVPRVSVVIAAYNADQFIEATCRSAMRQTFQAMEIVVVDDGSTDDTARIVQALSAEDPRIRLLRQPNQGVAAARNLAIAESSGEYVAPLDADDLWDPTKIERQVAALDAAAPDAAMAYCWWAWIDVAGRVLDRSPRWQVEGRVLDRLVEVNFTGSASVPLFRRDALEAAGGYDPVLRDNGCQGCEDWDVALRVAAAHPVVVVPATLVAYRRRDDSMSSACDTMWRSRLAVMKGLAERTPSITPAVLRRSQGQFALYLAGVSYWAGDTRGAFRWALRSGPLRLLAAVTPHVARLLVKRPRGASGTLMRVPEDIRLAHLDLPEPLIPYDRIYARYWQGRDPR